MKTEPESVRAARGYKGQVLFGGSPGSPSPGSPGSPGLRRKSSPAAAGSPPGDRPGSRGGGGGGGASSGSEDPPEHPTAEHPSADPSILRVLRGGLRRSVLPPAVVVAEDYCVAQLDVMWTPPAQRQAMEEARRPKPAEWRLITDRSLYEGRAVPYPSTTLFTRRTPTGSLHESTE